MFLLDTNSISELRRHKPHGAVVAWINAVGDKDLFISSVTIGEIQAGIEMTRQQAQEKGFQLEQWLDLVADSYNVKSTYASVFMTRAKIIHGMPDTLYKDAMVAATETYKYSYCSRSTSY